VSFYYVVNTQKTVGLILCAAPILCARSADISFGNMAHVLLVLAKANIIVTTHTG